MKNETDIKKLTDELKNIPKDKKIPSDVLGSYVGMDADGEYPIQDADDL